MRRRVRWQKISCRQAVQYQSKLWHYFDQKTHQGPHTRSQLTIYPGYFFSRSRSLVRIPRVEALMSNCCLVSRNAFHKTNLHCSCSRGCVHQIPTSRFPLSFSLFRSSVPTISFLLESHIELIPFLFHCFQSRLHRCRQRHLPPLPFNALSNKYEPQHCPL